MDQDKILEQKMRDIAEKVYAEKTLKSKYGVTQVPFHTHNGTDSTRISSKDIINNIVNFTFFGADDSNNNEVFALKNVPNVKSLQFVGLAAEIDSGTGQPTIQFVINGQANFGRCYVFEATPGGATTESVTAGEPFTQISNSFGVPTGGGTPRVSVAPNLAYASDGSNQVSLTIETYNNASIVIRALVAPDWILAGQLIVT